MFEQGVRLSQLPPEHIPLPLYAKSVGKRDYGDQAIDGVSSIVANYVGMIFCVRGSGTAYLFDRPFVMKENDMIFYYPNEEHCFRPDTGDCIKAWIDFDGPLAMSILAAYRFPRTLTLPGGFPEQIYQGLVQELPDSSESAIRYTSALIFQLFEYLGKGATINRENESRHMVERAIRVIMSNLPNCNLDVNFICESLGVHRSTFQKKFIAEMNFTPSEYIRTRRLAKARTLLAGTDLPIQEIGRQCGFLEKTSFSRFFKSFRDSMSPREYRKRYRTL